MTVTRGKNKTYLMAVMFMLAAVWSQIQYDSQTDYFSEKTVFFSLPSAKTLKIISFGYDYLTADMLFIWSIQFYSTTQIANRFEFLEPIYQLITDLCPSYHDPYLIGALFMNYGKKDTAMALRLLEKGSRNNPGELIFDWHAGFYAYQFLKDYDKARFYYEQASRKPGAPFILKRLAAHMVYMKNDPQTAWKIWLDVYREARTDTERTAAFNHLIQIKAEMDMTMMQRGVEIYKTHYRHPPLELQDLVKTGILKSIPLDLVGKPYEYHISEDGIVQFKRKIRWK